MATEITQKFKRNQTEWQERRDFFSKAKKAEPNTLEIRGKIQKLETEIMGNGEPGKRKTVLSRLLQYANAIKIRVSMLENEGKSLKNGDNEQILKKLAQAQQCLDQACFALERIAQSCDDLAMRHRAFEFIKFNPVAVKLTYELARYPDIKMAAGACLPKKPNMYYSFIGEDFKMHEESFRGIALRLLAYLRNNELDALQRNAMQKEASELLEYGNVQWGQAQNVARDVRAAINSARRIRKLQDITQKELADLVEGYVEGKKVAELADAFSKVKGMRLKKSE